MDRRKMSETAEENFDASKFVKFLKHNGKFDKVVEDLGNQDDDNKRVLFLEQLLKKHDLIPEFSANPWMKDQETSEMFRHLGNQQYDAKDFKDALKHYNAR